MACKFKINKFMQRVEELDLESFLPQIKCSPQSTVAPPLASNLDNKSERQQRTPLNIDSHINFGGKASELLVERFKQIYNTKKYIWLDDGAPYYLNLIAIRNSSPQRHYDDLLYVCYRDEALVWRVHVYPITTQPGYLPGKNLAMAPGQYIKAYQIGHTIDDKPDVRWGILGREEGRALVQRRHLYAPAYYISVNNGELRKQSLKSTAYASIRPAGYRSGEFDIYALPEYYDEYNVTDKYKGHQIFQSFKDFTFFMNLCEKIAQFRATANNISTAKWNSDESITYTLILDTDMGLQGIPGQNKL